MADREAVRERIAKRVAKRVAYLDAQVDEGATAQSGLNKIKKGLRGLDAEIAKLGNGSGSNGSSIEHEEQKSAEGAASAELMEKRKTKQLREEVERLRLQRREAELKSSEQQQLMRAAGLDDKIKGTYETEKRKQKLMEENELLMKCLGSKRDPEGVVFSSFVAQIDSAAEPKREGGYEG